MHWRWMICFDMQWKLCLCCSRTFHPQKVWCSTLSWFRKSSFLVWHREKASISYCFLQIVLLALIKQQLFLFWTIHLTVENQKKEKFLVFVFHNLICCRRHVCIGTVYICVNELINNKPKYQHTKEQKTTLNSIQVYATKLQTFWINSCFSFYTTLLFIVSAHTRFTWTSLLLTIFLLFEFHLFFVLQQF